MANIRKSFNFRNGVQVDEDNLIVNSLGLVGIGTSLPTESLDVRGTAKVVGLMTATQINSPNAVISGIATITRLSAGNISLNSGIVTSTSISGLVTYYGDGGKLLNLPTSQWVDVDSGFGYTSIYAAGNVGVSTNYPYSTFQVGGNPTNQRGVGINSTGSINATGIITAYEFVGFGTNIEGLDGSNITTGTINLDRLPTITSDKLTSNINVSGIITASQFVGNLNSTGVSTIANLQNTQINSGIITASSFVGNLTGNVNSTGVSTIANLQNTQINSGIITANYFTGGLIGISSFARDLTSDANIDIYNVVTDTFTTGFATVTSRLKSSSIGVNTDSPQSNIHILNEPEATLHLTGNQSRITLGRSISPTSNSSGLIFGNTLGIYQYSDSRTLDIVNYDAGNINHYLDYGASGVGTGSFNWIYAQNASNPLMTLTYDGNLGIGVTTPTNKLEVLGNVNLSSLNITGTFSAVGSGSSSSVETLYVYGGLSSILDINGNQLIIPTENQNLYITSGISTFQDISFTNGVLNTKVGIGNTTPLELLHIGSAMEQLNPLDGVAAVVLTDTGIGIGRTSVRFDLGIDCPQSGAIFESVGIGTTNPENPPGNKLYVNGPSVLNGNVSNTGILTSTNGFSSGIGTAVQITTVGNTLIFTVPGVGTTSLTLF